MTEHPVEMQIVSVSMEQLARNLIYDTGLSTPNHIGAQLGLSPITDAATDAAIESSARRRAAVAGLDALLVEIADVVGTAAVAFHANSADDMDIMPEAIANVMKAYISVAYSAIASALANLNDLGLITIQGVVHESVVGEQAGGAGGDYPSISGLDTGEPPSSKD